MIYNMILIFFNFYNAMFQETIRSHEIRHCNAILFSNSRMRALAFLEQYCLIDFTDEIKFLSLTFCSWNIQIKLRWIFMLAHAHNHVLYRSRCPDTCSNIKINSLFLLFQFMLTEVSLVCFTYVLNYIGVQSYAEMLQKNQACCA